MKNKDIDIDFNKITLNVSHEVADTVESLFWLFQKMPKDIIMSSSNNKLIIWNTKLNKKLEFKKT